MRSFPRPAWVAAAVLVQGALAVGVVQPQLSARLTGAEYRLAVAPVDPIDPFRGAYVQLSYPGLPDGPPGSAGFYVPLVRDGSLWKGTGPVTVRPKSPYLSCESHSCGLDSFFVPEERARAIEQDINADRLAAVIRVDDRGRAVLIRLEPR
ncbi:GDYXXLXY domain-containing protein [Actinocorallia populi]|uniref:GDYXXLXY domain-containing protein n=1 Tax=Actinocorallia populi TaxID=2079200 RepID=UPI000D08F5A9|nr:GDYXXLXY domain-containing protein [Actinocorallia populi]